MDTDPPRTLKVYVRPPRPDRPGYVARLDVYLDPPPGGDAPRPAPAVRHLREHRALGLAHELMALCPSVPTWLLAEVRRHRDAARGGAADDGGD